MKANSKNYNCEKCERRQELVSIFDNLTPSLKNQLLTQARIIETTQDIVLREKIKKNEERY
jgi:hypothetical protein